MRACLMNPRTSLCMLLQCKSQVLENDFVVLSAHSSHSSAGVSLLIGRSLDAEVNVIFTGDGSRLVVPDVAVKIFKFRVAAVYAPNITDERTSFFLLLAPFLDNPKWLVQVGDWNAIFDPYIDKVGQGVSRLERCENSLIDCA